MAAIYSEPEARETLDKYPQFVRDVITIIDYDGEITMGGLHEVIYGNLAEELPNILLALDNCGATQETDVLRRAKKMSREQYEADYERLTSLPNPEHF